MSTDYPDYIVCDCGRKVDIGFTKDSALLPRSIAEYDFSKYYPCMYEGRILCRECPRDECDMAAGRELHQMYFVAGWLSHEKQDNVLIRILRK